MKTFYPKDFGMTASDVADLIEERCEWADDEYYKRWSKVRPIAASELSDEDVQQFVTEWYDPLINLAGEGDLMYQAQEDALFKFAVHISKR